MRGDWAGWKLEILLETQKARPLFTNGRALTEHRSACYRRWPVPTTPERVGSQAPFGEHL
jgi:hypothetical protein